MGFFTWSGYFSSGERRGFTMSSAPQQGLSRVRYVFDPAISRFTVQAFATGLLASSLGHSPTIGILDFSGTVEFVAGSYERARVHMKINTNSLEVLDEMKRSDREKLHKEMFDNVLKASRFPLAIFESEHIDVNSDRHPLNVKLSGELTLRGVTRRHSFSARVSNADSSLRIAGEFALLQTLYGIKPASVAGGVVRLKDQLQFNFEIIAKRLP
jgi:polyisoprenoid-binding protein YceI